MAKTNGNVVNTKKIIFDFYYINLRPRFTPELFPNNSVSVSAYD